MAELKKCPFCGGKFEIVESGEDYRIKHDRVFSCPMFQNENSCNVWVFKQDAEIALNTHPLEDALQARIAEMEAALADLIKSSANYLASSELSAPPETDV